MTLSPVLSYQISKQQHAERRVLGNALTASTEHDQVLPLQRFPHDSGLWASCRLDSFYATHPPQQGTGIELWTQCCHTCIFFLFNHLITYFFYVCSPPAVISFLPAPVSRRRAHGENLQAGAAFKWAAGVLLCRSRATGQPSVANCVSTGVNFPLDNRK